MDITVKARDVLSKLLSDKKNVGRFLRIVMEGFG